MIKAKKLTESIELRNFADSINDLLKNLNQNSAEYTDEFHKINIEGKGFSAKLNEMNESLSLMKPLYDSIKTLIREVQKNNSLLEKIHAETRRI